MKRLVPLVAAGALILFLVACGSDSVEFDDVVVDSGTLVSSSFQFPCVYQAAASADSSLFKDGSLFTVIRDRADWQRIWSYVLENGRRYPSGGCPDAGEPPSFDVDFEREMVLMLVEVQPSSGYSLEIDRIRIDNEEWVVEATRTTPCCGVRPAHTYPHHVVSTPRFDGDVSLAITEVESPTPKRGQ